MTATYTLRNLLLILVELIESDCIYYFPIYFEQNGILFGSKPIGKLQMQSDYLLQQEFEEDLSVRYLFLF